MPFIIDFWHWWVFAIILTTLEIILPSFFALWLGIAAFFTGLLLLLFPDMSWQFQWLLFSLLAVMSIILWRKYYKKYPIRTDEPLLNRRGEQHIGRLVTLSSPIINGEGKVILDDSTWKVRGADCPAGTRVRIVGVENVILQVDIVS